MIKKAFKLSGALVLLYGTCAAEFQVGNGAFQLDTSVTGVYDSNLRASINNDSDYYLSLYPNLRYRRLGARFKTEGMAGLRFKRYLDNPDFNSDDAIARFDWTMAREDGHTTGARLGLDYTEASEADVEVNDQVRSKTFFGDAGGEVLIAGRNLLSASLTHRDRQHSIGSNQKSSTLGAGYSYVGFTDGTALGFNYSHQENRSTQNGSVGMRTLDQTADSASIVFTRPLYAQLVARANYGYRWLDRGQMETLLGLPDTKGSFYGVNFEGPFLPKKYFPKTTGTFRIGYEQAEMPGLNDKSNERLVGEVNVSWAARDTTSISFFASRSQSLTITDNTVVNESTGITVRQAIGSFIDADFSLRYTNADFVNLLRTDDRYEARASATYKINRIWSSQLGYTFYHNESSTPMANFQRHVISGTVNYAF